ncbi:MAG: hypothetical protein NVS2B16_13400 [Chloroflexota bacterium]
MVRIRLVTWSFVLLALASSVHFAFASPVNVLLARNRTEPVVVLDPARPSTIVAASNTNYSESVGGAFPTAFYTSHDNGRNFRFGTIPTVPPFTTGADPNMSSVRNGTLFYSFLGETPGYCSGGRSAILITSSIDAGDHFRSPTIVDVDPADDKPALATRSGRPQHAHVYMTWTRWHDTGSEIWYARSLDGGYSFSHPAQIFASRLDNFGSVPVVGPHGRVYIVWSSFPENALSARAPTQILMRTSSDDGATFGPPHAVTRTFLSVPRMAAPGSLRNLTGPAVATNARGTLYVAWASATRQRADNSVDANVEIVRSLNGGATWSKPAVVNDTTKGDRFMPAISVMHDDSVGLAFYDRRNSPWQLDVYAARVNYAHGFHRAPNVRVGHAPSPISDIYYLAPGSTCFSPGRFFGDYIGTAVSRDDRLCVVWADTQTQVPQETDIWFAKIKLPPVREPRS